MNWLDLISLIPEILSLEPEVQSTLSTGGSILAKVEALAPTLGKLIGDVGSQLFPKVAPELQAVAAVTTTFSPDTTVWLQRALNAFDGATTDVAITVDGIYGPQTVAAVEAAQTKLGVSVDGWAGQITLAALRLATKEFPSLGVTS